MEAQVLSEWLSHSMPSFSVKRGQQGAQDSLVTDDAAKTAPFSGMVSRIADAYQGPVQAASNIVNRFSKGSEGEIHESMMALEKSDIGFKFLVSAKNKAIEAYKETMRMG